MYESLTSPLIFGTCFYESSLFAGVLGLTLGFHLARFDRILSIESKPVRIRGAHRSQSEHFLAVLEHMKNYRRLFSKINSWLKPNELASGTEGSLFFAHIFCHRDTPYHFEEGDGWMSQTFFSGVFGRVNLMDVCPFLNSRSSHFIGGTMPSFDLFTYFQQDMVLQRNWWINGRHYSRTLEDWLKLQDKNNRSGSSIKALEKDALATGMTAEEGRASFYRFRVFFLTCAEFFGLDGGETWGVGHYLFRKRD